MKEIGDDFSDGLFVVDEGLENLGLTICWDDVVIGNGSGHETGGAFGDGYFVASTSYSQLAIAIEHHEDDEGVVLDHVAMERLRGIYYLD